MPIQYNRSAGNDNAKEKNEGNANLTNHEAAVLMPSRAWQASQVRMTSRVVSEGQMMTLRPSEGPQGAAHMLYHPMILCAQRS